MNVVVIGGGIAGSSVALFAARRGAHVTLIDAAEGTASNVPAALINPVRGQNGKVDRQALEGQKVIWALIDKLEVSGFRVPHSRAGLLRPVPDERVAARWTANFPPDLDYRWLEAQVISELAEGWSRVLELPGSGWIEGPALVRGLQALSGAAVVRDWAVKVNAKRVTVSSGEEFVADRVVWCGGSIGASRRGTVAQHRGGTVLLTSRALTTRPVSFGVYATPGSAGGVLGATFEAPTPVFNDQLAPDASLNWLLDGAHRLLAGFDGSWSSTWSGSRLSNLVAGPQPDGTWALTGLGSKGYLLGPVLARNLVSAPEFLSP